MHDLRYFYAVTSLAKPAMERDYLTLLRDIGESLTLLSGGNISREAATLASHLLGCPTSRELETLLAHPES